jgi:hypothetical protein
MTTIRSEILKTVLESLDVIDLNHLYKQIGCNFKYNLENYTTEADPQKMIYIVFKILHRFSIGEFEKMISEVFESQTFQDSKSELKNNICVVSLLGLLDVYYNYPDFLNEMDFTTLKETLMKKNNNNLFGYNYSQLLNVEKTNLSMKYIQKQTETLHSDIEIFFSSHFGKGKILAGSLKTQEFIIQIILFLQNNQFHSNLENVFNKFVGKVLNLIIVRTQKQLTNRNSKWHVSIGENKCGDHCHGGDHLTTS